jgi:putative Mg2+ transporter-C (MgtC) family protein
MLFDLEMILRLLLAAVLGGVIGAEREHSNRGAGLRTHALVSTASALAMIISGHGFMEVLCPGKIVLDPSRVAAQVVSGVGFLGAGIIIFRKNTVRGLTTAASIWAVAVIGLAIGSGLYIISFGATSILCFILAVMKPMEKRFFPQRHANNLTIELNPNAVRIVADKLKIAGLKVLNMNVQAKKGANSTLKVEIIAEEKVFTTLFQQLQAIPDVYSISYRGHIMPVDGLNSEEFEEDENLDALNENESDNL